MASVLTKSFFPTAKVCNNFQRLSILNKSLKVNPNIASRYIVSSNFSTSLLINKPTSTRTLVSKLTRNYKSTNSWPTVSCACGSFHSKSDAAFSELLSEEISGEKERMLNVPQPLQGWDFAHSGADCTLSTNVQGDRIEVKFNVNASVPPATSEDPEEEQDIIAQPDFTVQLKKSSSQDSLTFECYFPDEELEEEGEHENVFSLRSVIMHKGEINDETYIIDTDNIDPNLYQHFFTFLGERGINNDFAENLVDIATAVENQQYIASLESLHGFVSCK